MKLRLIFVQSSKEEWFASAQALYQKKISAFQEFEVKSIKSKAMARSSAEEKKQKESEALLKELSSKDYVILFDENGKSFSQTYAFNEDFLKVLESGKQSVTFVIGGAFGSSDELKQRADRLWSLSGLTMNHMLATVVAMEQIYRCFTIQKNLPYHNI